MTGLTHAMPEDGAAPVTAYFVCATPRTGSSLLLGLLESTGVAGRPQAYFRVPDEPLWADRWRLPRGPGGAFAYPDYLAAALAAGRGDNGVFGAKLMWGTLDELVGKLAVVHPDLAGDDIALLNRVFGRTRFVYVRRADVLAQAVSWLRAEQSGVWRLGGHGEVSGASPAGRPAGFDAAGVTRLIGTVQEHHAAWRDWFAAGGIEPYEVCYEDLVADPTGTVQGILDFLGLQLPPGHLPTARHRRQADALNDQWMARYRTESAGH